MVSETTGNSSNRRIIVFVPNRPGSLAEIAGVLGRAEVNIETIDGRQAGEFGVISLTTNDDDAALHALLEAELRAVTSDAVVFHLPDRPGALAGAAQLLAEHQVNVRTIHIESRIEGHAIVAVTTDNDDLARSLLASDMLY